MQNGNRVRLAQAAVVDDGHDHDARFGSEQPNARLVRVGLVDQVPLVLGMMDSAQMTLYAAAPGEQARVWLREPGGSSAAADSCGRVVALGNAGGTSSWSGWRLRKMSPRKVSWPDQARKRFAESPRPFIHR